MAKTYWLLACRIPQDVDEIINPSSPDSYISEQDLLQRFADHNEGVISNDESAYRFCEKGADFTNTVHEFAKSLNRILLLLWREEQILTFFQQGLVVCPEGFSPSTPSEKPKTIGEVLIYFSDELDKHADKVGRKRREERRQNQKEHNAENQNH